MTKKEQKFWDILRLPYKKTCQNCKHDVTYKENDICSGCLKPKFRGLAGRNDHDWPSNWKWAHD